MTNPVIFSDGTKVWFDDGECHKDDGPAIIYPGGGLFWYFKGECLTFDKWLKELEPESAVMMKMKYG